MRKTIFVGGIHGVGKTTFCNRLATQFAIPHYSASQLISKARNDLISKDKKVKKIANNQDILISALNLYISDPIILLDGHYCLLDEKMHIQRIPEETFRTISPVVLITLKAPVDLIIRRLNLRDSRSFNSSLIELFQNEELNYSAELSKLLGVSHYIYETTNVVDFKFDNLLKLFDD